MATLTRTNLGLLAKHESDFDASDWTTHGDVVLDDNTGTNLSIAKNAAPPPGWVTVRYDTAVVPAATTRLLVISESQWFGTEAGSNFFGPGAHLNAGAATEDQDGVTMLSSNQRGDERNAVLEVGDGVNLGTGNGRSTDDQPRAKTTDYWLSLFADGTDYYGYDFLDDAILSATCVVAAGGAGFIYQLQDGDTLSDLVKRFYACSDRYLIVTDLPTGWKAKVRNNVGGTLAEATESSGEASVDMLKVKPTEAHDLVVTDGGDVVQATVTPGDGLWGGDEYSCLAGQGIGTLPPLEAEATGSYSVPSYVGAGAGILPVLLCLAAGTFGYPVGAGAGSLPALTGVGAGTYGYPVGAGAGTLAPLTGVGAGTAYDHSGAGAGTLAPLTAVGTGTYGYPAGAGAGILSALTAVATGTYAIPVYSGAGAGTLAPLTAVATGTYAIPVYSGAGDGTLAPLTTAGEGTYGYPAGAGAGTLAPLTTVATGTAYDHPGAGAGTLAPLTGEATGWLGRAAGSTRREYQSEFDDGTVEGTSFERRPDAVSRSYLQALAPGPRSLSDAAEGLLVKGWYCRADNEAGKVYLCPAKDDIRLGWSTEVELFSYTGDDIDEISLAFDQNGAPVVVAERDGNIWIRYYDPGESGYVFEDFGVGRNPRMVLDDPQNVTDSDLLIFYIRDGELRIREQGDLYVSEVSPGDSLGATNYIEGVLRDHKNRVHVIISTRDLLAGTYVLTRISSQLYPFYLSSESLDIRNKAIAGAIVTALIIYEMPEESLDVANSAVAGEIEIISRPEDAPAYFDLALSVDSVEVIIFVILYEPDAESLDIANSAIAGTIVTAAIEYAPDAEALDVGNSAIAGTIETP